MRISVIWIYTDKEATTGGSRPEKYFQRGLVACKCSSKHILKHICHVDSPIIASIFTLLIQRRYILGTRVGYIWESVHERVSRRNIE